MKHMNFSDASRRFFDELALHWDDRQPERREDGLHRLISRFDTLLSKDFRILEAGCGTGALLPILHQRYRNAIIHAVDLSLPMLQRVGERQGMADLAQADVHALPFEDLAFSTVICHDSFPHFQDKVSALGEIRRVLVEDGRVFILHDISREHVNGVHRRAWADAIHGDVLPDGATLQRILETAGLHPAFIRDDEECFLAVGIKESI